MPLAIKWKSAWWTLLTTSMLCTWKTLLKYQAIIAWCNFTSTTAAAAVTDTTHPVHDHRRRSFSFMVVHIVFFHLNYWLQAISKLRTNAPLALHIVHMHAYRALTTCKLSFQHENQHQHWCDLCNKKHFSFLSIDNGHNSNPIKSFSLKHHYDDWSIDSFRE